MSTLQILPALAYAGCIASVLLVGYGWRAPRALQWILPAALGALFLFFSLLTLARDGLLQFWINHTQNLAGNQVWIDLLFAVTVGFVLIAPRARADGMRLMPWSVAIFLTACVALLPMLARLVWLEQHQKTTAS